jgi:hypothetical protein
VLSSIFAGGGRIVNRETDSPDGRLEVGEPCVTYRYVGCRTDKPKDELWIEVRLDADWVAAYLIEPQDGRPVVAEVRVLPYEDRTERTALLGPGEWSRGDVPSGGIPVELVRSLRSEEIVRVMQEQLEEWPLEAEYLEDVLADFGFDPGG